MTPSSSVPETNINNMCINIDELIDGIEDVNDPSSMDKVLGYVELIREQDDNFIDLLTQKVHNAEIYWKIPWYQEHGSLIRQAPLFAVGGETTMYRTDTMSQEEHDLIEKNWRKFRKKYKLPDQIISLARWKNKTKSKNPMQCAEEKARRFAVAYLARGLQRTNSQVFKHITAHYGGYRKGYYSKTEEKIIEICFHHQPKLIASILSLVLGREPRGVYKRLDHLTHGKPEKKRMKWTLPLASKLVRHLLKYTEMELEDLKNRQIEMWVWRKLEEDMDHNSSYLQHFWYCYLHVQLFVKCDIKLYKLRKKLFKKLRAKVSESAYKVWSDIRWKDIVIDFPDGFTPRFLYRVCNLYLRRLKGYIRMPLEDVVDHALQKIKKQKEKKRNKRLRTLRFTEDGQLEVVDYRY